MNNQKNIIHNTMRNFIYLIVIVFLAACGSGDDNKKAQLDKLKKEQAEINAKIAKLEAELGSNKDTLYKDVNVYEVKSSTFRNYIEIQGRVDAEENVQVNPEAAGVLTKIFVAIGQNVSKGQVIAQIDDAVLRQNMAQLQTQLDLAVNLYNRQKNLWDQKIGTEVQFLNAKTQKEALEKQMAVLRQQAAMYKVKSPINGTVDQLDWKIGMAVQPGAPGVRVVNANDLKAKALLSETYASRIDKGDEVEIIIPDAKDSLTTKLSFTSKVIDPVSRSFSVEVNLPSKKIYRPNMLAVLKIVDYEKANALTVPIKAVQKSEAGDYLLVADNGKAKRVAVKIGNVYNGMAEVLSGLNAGDKVITVGFNNLNEGDLVKF
jgi:RND family efflux transporter MFP subunit